MIMEIQNIITEKYIYKNRCRIAPKIFKFNFSLDFIILFIYNNYNEQKEKEN